MALLRFLRQTGMQLHLAITSPHPTTMLKSTTCFFFWFSTWYLVGRGTNNAFIRGKQRFAQISVVKHIQFVKLGPNSSKFVKLCPKDIFFHDCSSCNLKSLFFLSGMRLTAIPGFIVHWPSSNHNQLLLARTLFLRLASVHVITLSFA